MAGTQLFAGERELLFCDAAAVVQTMVDGLRCLAARKDKDMKFITGLEEGEAALRAAINTVADNIEAGKDYTVAHAPLYFDRNDCLMTPDEVWKQDNPPIPG